MREAWFEENEKVPQDIPKMMGNASRSREEEKEERII